MVRTWPGHAPDTSPSHQITRGFTTDHAAPAAGDVLPPAGRDGAARTRAVAVDGRMPVRWAMMCAVAIAIIADPGGFMRFGQFEDTSREYVITTPRTPYPWINYLGTEQFFGLVSHTGGGYCFYRDARLRRLTRYRYNSVPTDVGGRYYYLHDAGDYWTPGWLPVKRELDFYE